MNPTDETRRSETNCVQEPHRKQGIKFALFTTNTRREQGGEYTFESEILRAWLKWPSHHETSICSLGKVVPFGLDLNGAQHISLDFSRTQRAPAKLVTEFRLLLQRVRLGQTDHSRLHDVGHKMASVRLNSHGIRFIWYLSPWSVPFPDIPYALTVWDLQHRVQPFFPEVSGGEWFRREHHLEHVLQHASFVVTGTNQGKSEIQQFYGIDSSRIRVIPLPTPSFALEEQTDAEISAFRKLNVPARYLFYPAQFWPHKNHAVLLHTLRILKERSADPSGLVFVGHDHGNKSHIEKLASDLGVRHLVHFLGFVSVQEMKALYRNAAALVFPSYFGPDNLPPLEAFALGCPVIAADVPGASEQLGDAALFVAPSSELDFAQAIQRLEQNPSLREDLVSRGRKRAMSFLPSGYVQQMSKILDEFSSIARCWT